MNKAEALETIDDYEDDFEEISSIIADPDLTPSQKVSQISDIIDSGEEDDEGEEEE